MAELIKKVVRATQQGDNDGRSTSGIGPGGKSSRTTDGPHGTTNQDHGRSRFTGLISRGASMAGPTRYTAHIELGSMEDVSNSKQGQDSMQGIHKTVITEVVRSNVKDNDTETSQSSLTGQVERKYSI